MQPPFIHDFGVPIEGDDEPGYDEALIQCLQNLRSRENQLFREWVALAPNPRANRTTKAQVAFAYWDSLRSAVRAVMGRCHKVGLNIDAILDAEDRKEVKTPLAPNHRPA
jgi:hypothetical protein